MVYFRILSLEERRKREAEEAQKEATPPASDHEGDAAEDGDKNPLEEEKKEAVPQQ